MIPEQNLPWWRHDRPWGFRFSWMDALVFVSGGVFTAIAWPSFEVFALFIPYLLGHFFLFCNTFRIGGERSLIWVFTFLLNVFLWPIMQQLTLQALIQLGITIALILNCVLGKNYHGFLCSSLNAANYKSGALAEGAFTRRALLARRIPTSLIEILVGRRLEEFETNKD